MIDEDEINDCMNRYFSAMESILDQVKYIDDIISTNKLYNYQEVLNYLDELNKYSVKY